MQISVLACLFTSISTLAGKRNFTFNNYVFAT